jgi:hypothetical protein
MSDNGVFKACLGSVYQVCLRFAAETDSEISKLIMTIQFSNKQSVPKSLQLKAS